MKRNHYQNKSEKVFYQRISNETFPAKRLERGITPGKRNRPKKTEDMFTKFSLKTMSLPKFLWRKIYTKQISTEASTKKVLEKTFLPETIWRNISTTQLQKEHLPKRFEETIFTKNIWRKTLKYLQTKFYPNIYICGKILYQTICQGKLLDRELFQHIAKETSTKEYLKSMPTKNVLKTNLCEKNI